MRITGQITPSEYTENQKFTRKTTCWNEKIKKRLVEYYSLLMPHRLKPHYSALRKLYFYVAARALGWGRFVLYCPAKICTVTFTSKMQRTDGANEWERYYTANIYRKTVHF